jgi:preprotein translocase subunit SecA
MSSSKAALFSDVALASGRPYAERAEDESRWHDRLAVHLYRAAVAPLQRALAGFDGELQRLVDATHGLEEGLRLLPDEELRRRAAALRPRLRQEGFAIEPAAECFALIREAAGRVLGQRHFDSQLRGGYALLRGRLVEMATGEGKTFCATLPVCTVALAGYPVHVITVNDYLAGRDAEKMRPLYAFFGLGTGVVAQGMEKPLRRAAYAQPITYGTNKEIAFDYLRDRVALQGRTSRLHQSLRRLAGEGNSHDATVLRGLYFAVVDEADSVFVDEARTPLILSASGSDAEEAAESADALQLARSLEEGQDYQVQPFEHMVTLTDAGRARLDVFSESRSGSWTSVRAREDLLRQALAALYLYKRDQHYVVVEDKVQIVDESTGRVMPDRSWERGLHQLIEVKEGVPPTPRRETLARLTYQRLFRRYVHLAGMTGTAAEAAREIRAVYGLEIARIPLHRPSRRVQHPARFFLTRDEKWNCVADAAQAMAAAGRPVLIGTRSVEASEQISALLQRRGLPHALLNAKQDVEEARVVAEAGEAGRITVATNMAGRGTDILLGPGVEARGGLHVILTEFHDSRRVDRQLVGRCGRQGDPGSCEAIVSLEDDIFEVCAPSATALLRRTMAAGLPAPPVALDTLRRVAQHAAESRQAAIRMQNLKQDGQLNRALAFTGKSE